MELVPAGVPLSFEVTFDLDNLNVGMSVYDDSGIAPVLVYGPVAMTNVVGNTYRGKFTAVAGKPYVVFKAVYTSNTLAVLDTNYPQASESMIAEYLSGSSGCSVIGYVENGNQEDSCLVDAFVIFTGDDKTMFLKALYESSLDPVNLTACTEIDIALPLADGSFAHRLLSLGQVSIIAPSLLGKFSAQIPSTVSAQLEIGEFQYFDVTFTISGEKTTIRYFKSLTVFER